MVAQNNSKAQNLKALQQVKKHRGKPQKRITAIPKGIGQILQCTTGSLKGI